MLNSELKLMYTDESKIHSSTIEDYVIDAGIFSSKREAREFHKNNALRINKEVVDFKYKYILWVTKAHWDIPNKVLTPYYLLTTEEYEQVQIQGGI